MLKHLTEYTTSQREWCYVAHSLLSLCKWGRRPNQVEHSTSYICFILRANRRLASIRRARAATSALELVSLFFGELSFLFVAALPVIRPISRPIRPSLGLRRICFVCRPSAHLPMGSVFGVILRIMHEKNTPYADYFVRFLIWNTTFVEIFTHFWEIYVVFICFFLEIWTFLRTYGALPRALRSYLIDYFIRITDYFVVSDKNIAHFMRYFIEFCNISQNYAPNMLILLLFS